MNILGKTSLLSDSELIIRYKKNSDQSLFAELYSRYTHLILGVCMKYLKNSDAAQDGVMDIYESVSEKIKTTDVSNFGGWVYVITKNYCLVELRKQAKAGFIENTLTDGMEFTLETHHSIDHSLEDQLTVLEKCIEELSKEQAKCVNLFYLKKKSYKEVTNLTGYELNKVKSSIQNGKRNLKNCIEANIEKE